MRLLNSTTFQFEEFHDIRINDALKQCAIISHRWGDLELNFEACQKLLDDSNHREDSENGRPTRMERLLRNPAECDYDPTDSEIFKQHKNGIKKAAQACFAARNREHGGSMKYIWIDSFCINQEDSRERDHAFLSMFRWYQHANICYAYIADVTEPAETLTGEVNEERLRQFSNSKWFTRGWTLQELLAPPEIYFFDREWKLIGKKTDLISQIHVATGIDAEYLLKGDLSKACIAVKMSWLARRTTKYLEDMAYCMVGIFDIEMKFGYGEEERAFLRLEEELAQQKSTDESLYAWRQKGLPSYGLLAPWVTCFAKSGNLVIESWKAEKREPCSVVNQGIDFKIPNKLPDNGHSRDWNKINARFRQRYSLKLNCWEGSEHQNTVAIPLKKVKGQWRRINCWDWDWVWRPRSSFSVFGTKTSTIRIPHHGIDEPKWGDKGIYFFGNKLIQSKPKPEEENE